MILGENVKKYLSTYIPCGVLMFIAIDPIFETKQWLYDVITTVEVIAILVCVIGLAFITKSFKGFINSILDTKLTGVIWLFTALIGLLVGYTVGEEDLMIMWGILAFGVLVCLFLPNKQQKE